MLGTDLNQRTAAVGIVALHGPGQVGHGQTVLTHFEGIDHDVDLLDLPTPNVDVGQAGHGLQRRPHHPVHQGTSLSQGELGIVEAKIQDFAQAAADGRQFHLGALRHLLDGRLQALVDQLAGEVDVGVVLKDQRDLGKPELRDRAGLGYFGQARKGQFQRKGDPPFDLFGSQGRSHRVQLNLTIGYVRHGIDGQTQKIDHTDHQEDQR